MSRDIKIDGVKEIMNGFEHHFNVKAIFMDKPMTSMFGKYSFDIIEFDDYAHEHWGYTEEQHGSLQDFVNGRFGPEAVEFLCRLLEVG